MSTREKLTERIEAGGNYFTTPKDATGFIPTGCKLLDLALGGGWAERRIINIVGDKSTGKTLLCIEAAANFNIKYPKGKIRYRECESAFDPPYADALGMPIDKVDFGGPLETVEDFFEDLSSVIAKAKEPELYIVDSLDALSDRAELERSMDEGTYGTLKAKNLSQLFRRLTSQMAKANVTLMIVSQVRSQIGVTFGRGITRSGGRALDFYASQVLYLSHLATLNRTVQENRRAVGIQVRAKVDKNKIGLPFREAQFNIMFGFGVDDAEACVTYLKNLKGAFEEVGIVPRPGKTLEQATKEYLKNLPTSKTYHSDLGKLQEVVCKRWYEIEKTLIPTRRKYGGDHGKTTDGDPTSSNQARGDQGEQQPSTDSSVEDEVARS